MKNTELQRVAQQLQEEAAQLPRIDPKALSLVTDSARAFSGLDPNLIPSVTKAFARIDTAALVNSSALHRPRVRLTAP